MSFLSPSQVQLATYALSHTFVYFLHKTKMVDDRFVDFCHVLLSCTLFAHIGPPKTLYSTIQALVKFGGDSAKDA